MPESADVPDMLQVLAELELLRRKSTLLERRVASWESELVELRQRLEAVEKARDPESPKWLERLDDVAHRVDRLERRRAAAAANPSLPLSPTTSGTARGATYDVDAVALVRARWEPNQSKPGGTVQLLAAADGIEAGTPIQFVIRSLVEETPIAEITGSCDGDLATARWKVPKKVAFREIVFEAHHAGASTRSPVLVLP